MRPLTHSELNALHAYQTWCKGRGLAWRNQLTRDWLRAGSRWPLASQLWHHLQRLRNDLGPRWLSTFEE